MTRRIPLPKITECEQKQKRTEWMTASRMLRVVSPFIVVCVLSLLHVQLQFQKSDMRAQEGRLQLQHRRLMHEEAMLQKQYEMLCDPDILMARAKLDFNMQELKNPRGNIVAVVPENLQTKYTEVGKPTEKTLEVAEIRKDKHRKSLRDVVFTLLDGGRAIASTVSE